jgi:hypothetical protein
MVDFESGNPPTRSLTPEGKKVTDWSKTLPVTGGEQNIPGHRQQAAVAAGFIYKFGDMEVLDFMSNADYNAVMASNGPPRYDIFTGTYYDYGAHENGHPSGVVICTDPSLLVVKGSKDGVVPPPEEETPPGFVPGTPGHERPDRPDRERPDRGAGRDERKAERDAKQDERQAGRDENQAERDARRDERKN